jgi:RCC1 and BTB domain-containing protein
MVALVNLVALAATVEEWKESTALLVYVEEEEQQEQQMLALAQPGGSEYKSGSGSRKPLYGGSGGSGTTPNPPNGGIGGYNYPPGSGTDRPLSGQKKELIEKSLSKQQSKAADPAAASSSSFPHNGKIVLKIDANMKQQQQQQQLEGGPHDYPDCAADDPAAGGNEVQEEDGVSVNLTGSEGKGKSKSKKSSSLPNMYGNDDARLLSPVGDHHHSKSKNGGNSFFPAEKGNLNNSSSPACPIGNIYSNSNNIVTGSAILALDGGKQQQLMLHSGASSPFRNAGPGSSSSSSSNGSVAMMFLDKDAKMRVRRVPGAPRPPGNGHHKVTALTMPSNNPSLRSAKQGQGQGQGEGESGVGSEAYQPRSGSMIAPHESKARGLLHTLQGMHRVPKPVLQIVRDSAEKLNARTASIAAQKAKLQSGKTKHKPAVWDAKAASTAATARSSTAEVQHYVWAAGQNSYGELGLGDTSQRRRFTELPSQLYLHNKIVSVGAGNEHSVFVTDRGKVFVVGYNENGQCGLGNTQQARGPHALYALENEDVVQVHVHNGCEHTLAVTKEGKLYAFGYNYRGQLGVGSTSSEVSPRVVKSLLTRRVVSAASSYHHSLILCDDGSLFSVGRNDCGQLGHGDSVDKKVPVLAAMPEGEQVVTMSCGQFHSVLGCASGAAFACGKNDYGQVGLDTTENTKVLTKLPAFADGALVQQVCCGYYHTLVLLLNGVLVGFGRNDYGQLGLGHTQPRVNGYYVISVLGDKNVCSVSAGCYHSIAVAANGMLYVFGRNNHGQLGTGDLNERHTPHAVDTFLGRRILQVAAGFYHTLVLAADMPDAIDHARPRGGRQAAVVPAAFSASSGVAAAIFGGSKVVSRVDGQEDTSLLAFDEYFSSSMRHRLLMRGARGASGGGGADNQQGQPLAVLTEEGTAAITEALQELMAPGMAFTVGSGRSHSKLTVQTMLPFLVEVLVAATRRSSNTGGGGYKRSSRSGDAANARYVFCYTIFLPFFSCLRCFCHSLIRLLLPDYTL